MIEDPNRVTGRTTRQISEAPQDAIYVWPNGNLSYPLALTRELNRPDIAVVPPVFLRADRVCSTSQPIVLDHETPRHLNDEQFYAWGLIIKKKQAGAIK